MKVRGKRLISYVSLFFGILFAMGLFISGSAYADDIATEKDADGYYKIETYEQFLNISKLIEPGYMNYVKVRIYADIDQKDSLNSNKWEVGYKRVLLDLNGHTVSRTTRSIDNSLISMSQGGSELTIEDSAGGGRLYFCNTALVVEEPGVIDCSDGELIIKGGTIEIEGCNDGGAIFQGSRGKVYIYGGTFKSDNYAIRSFIVNGITSGKICIYGGDFYSKFHSKIYSSSSYPVGSQIYIFGGNFHSEKEYNSQRLSFENSRGDIVYAGGTFSYGLKNYSKGHSFDLNGEITSLSKEYYGKDTLDGYGRVIVILPPTISIGDGLTREDYLFRMARKTIGTYYSTDADRKDGYKEAFTNYMYDYLDYPGVSVTYYSYSNKTSLITLNDLITGSDDIDNIVWKKSYDGENYEVVESAKGKTSWKPEYESGEKVYYKAEVTRYYETSAGAKSKKEEAFCYVKYEAANLLKGNAYILCDTVYNQPVKVAFSGDEEFMKLYNEGKLTYTWKYSNNSDSLNYTLKDGLDNYYAKVSGYSITPKTQLVNKYICLEVSAKDLGYANTIVTEVKQVGQAPNNNLSKLPVVAGVTSTSITIKKAPTKQEYLLYEKSRIDGQDFNTLDWSKARHFSAAETALTNESDGVALAANKVYCLVTREYAGNGYGPSEAIALTITTSGASALNKDYMVLNGVSAGGTIYIDYDEYECVDGYVTFDISTDPSGLYTWENHSWAITGSYGHVVTEVGDGADNKVGASTGAGKMYPQTVAIQLNTNLASDYSGVQYDYIKVGTSSDSEKYGSWSLRVYRGSAVSLSNLVPTFYEDGKEINSSSKANIIVNEQSTVSPFEKITMIPSSDRYKIRWYGVTNQSGTIVKNATNEYFTVDINTGAITGVKNNASIYNGVPQHRVAAFIYDTVTGTEKDANLSFLVKVIDKKHINVKGIILDTKEAVMLKNDTLSVGAILSPSGATGTVNWSSDNTLVATVDASGKITSVGAGDAVITAKVYSSTEVTSTVNVHVHGLVEVPAVESTCQTTGNVKYYKCSACNKVFSSTTLESIAANKDVFVTAEKAHSFDTGTVTRAATCTEEGETVYKCIYAGCDKSIHFATEKLEHNYSTIWSKDADNHWKECSCGDKKDSAAHTFEWQIDKAATTTEEGSKHEECTVCGYKKDAVSIDKITADHIHSYSTTWSKDADNHWKACECGAVSEKAAHSWGTGVVKTEATVASAGEKVYTCSVCEATKSEELPKLIKEACATHTWDEGVVKTEATATSVGEKVYTCKVCGTTQSEEIPKLTVTTITKGTVLTDTKKNVYVVTNASKKTVTLKTYKNTSAKTISVNTVKIGGVTYKVTAIGEKAFTKCKKATKITLGTNVTSIGASAFSGLSKLSKVTIGKNVTTIGAKAFYKCSALASITIPEKVTKIGGNAFYGCSKLKTITISSKKLTSKTVSKNAFKGISKSATVKAPKNYAKKYKTLLKSKGYNGKVK